MIIQGSMRYSPSGRKRKTNAWKKKRRHQFVAKAQKNVKPSRETTPHIPSLKTTKYTPEVDNSWKVEESKQYTVAPAYNKGAYQVIPASDVEHIGK